MKIKKILQSGGFELFINYFAETSSGILFLARTSIIRTHRSERPLISVAHAPPSRVMDATFPFLSITEAIPVVVSTISAIVRRSSPERSCTQLTPRTSQLTVSVLLQNFNPDSSGNITTNC